MRYFFLLAYLISTTPVVAQNKNCSYRIDVSAMADPLHVQQITDSLRQIQLQTVNNKKYLPDIVRKTLDCWTNNFQIANPGKRHQSGDVSVPAPLRQLIYLGLSDRYLIMTYKKGGKTTSDHILFFKFDKEKILDFWAGGNVRLNSQQEVISFLQNQPEVLQSNDLNF